MVSDQEESGNPEIGALRNRLNTLQIGASQETMLEMMAKVLKSQGGISRIASCNACDAPICSAFS